MVYIFVLLFVCLFFVCLFLFDCSFCGGLGVCGFFWGRCYYCCCYWEDG